MDSLPDPQQHKPKPSKSKTSEKRRTLGEEMRQLFKETQAIHADNPLTEEEIQAEIDAYRRGE
jgi:hypothetical protein